MSKREDALRASLHKMLDAYWGRGDGARPPEFVIEAAKLAGYTLNDMPEGYTPPPFAERDIPVVLKGEEWFALLARATGRELSVAGAMIYRSATVRVSAALKGESDRGHCVRRMTEAVL